MTSKEIHENLVQILVEDFSSYATMKKWAERFKRSSDSTEDDPRSDLPKTSNTDEQVITY